MIPVAIPSAGGTLFAAYHPAPGPGPAVLFCPGFGYEALATARIWRDFAVRLAAQGVAVLRPDLPGTGDSADPPDGSRLVAAWRAAVRASADWLAERHGGTASLLGCRLGALLALDAVAGGFAADRLVLLDPPASGAAFARALKARARLEGHGEPPEGPGFVQAYGVTMGPETLEDLAALPAGGPAAGTAPLSVLAALCGRPDGTGPAWLDGLRAAGAAVTVVPFEGHAAFLLQSSMRTVEPAAVFDRVLAFLAVGRAGAGAAVPEAPAPEGLVLPGLREEPVTFGPGLFGLLCLPDRPLPAAPAVVLPSVANLPRSGHDRLWTTFARRLAARGVASLRFDMGGVADSAGGARLAPVIEAYLPDRIADLRAALDFLGSRGFPRAAVVGLCSGGYVGWQAAAVDARIVALLAGNPQVLDLQTRRSAAALLRQVPADAEPGGGEGAADAPAPRRRASPRKLRAAAHALKRAVKRHCPAPLWERLLAMGAEERRARRHLRRLVGRGCAVHFVFADAPGEDYRFRRAFGADPTLPPGARLTRVAGADHEFSARRHRARFLDIAAEFALSPPASGPAPAGVPAQAAVPAGRGPVGRALGGGGTRAPGGEARPASNQHPEGRTA